MAKLNLDDNFNVSESVSFNRPIHYSQVIGATAVEVKSPITGAQLPDRGFILIQALSTNNAPIYVGHDDTVTAAENSGTGGYELQPGSEIAIGLSNSSFNISREVWVISTGAGQEIRVLEK